MCSMVKIVFAPLPKGFCIALERVYDLDLVSAIKRDLGPAINSSLGH